MTSASKVVELPALLAFRRGCRERGQVVAWTNGCFDLVHAGHVRSLEAARACGDVLVVGVNSDRSVRQYKGNGRPLLAEGERAALLAALECVSRVMIFDDLEPSAILAQLQPDVHCKGMDYAPPHGKPIPEAAVVAAYGGQVRFLDLVPGVSTTELIRRIRALPDGAI